MIVPKIYIYIYLPRSPSLFARSQPAASHVLLKIANLRISFASTHDFGKWQVIFVVKFGILIQTEIRETFAFLVSPRFFSFISSRLLVQGLWRLNLFVRLAVCSDRILIVIIIIVAGSLGLCKVRVSLVERPSAHNVLAVVALQICFLTLAEIVYIHRLREAVSLERRAWSSVDPVWVWRRPGFAGIWANA